MREITLSQAVNEALAEEMRRDETVFIIGEDVAEAGTPFKVSVRPCRRVRHRSRCRHAYCRAGFYGHRRGRCNDRYAPRRGSDVWRFHFL